MSHKYANISQLGVSSSLQEDNSHASSGCDQVEQGRTGYAEPVGAESHGVAGPGFTGPDDLAGRRASGEPGNRRPARRSSRHGGQVAAALRGRATGGRRARSAGPRSAGAQAETLGADDRRSHAAYDAEGRDALERALAGQTSGRRQVAGAAGLADARVGAAPRADVQAQPRQTLHREADRR